MEPRKQRTLWWVRAEQFPESQAKKGSFGVRPPPEREDGLAPASEHKPSESQGCGVPEAHVTPTGKVSTRETKSKSRELFKGKI